MHVILMAKTNPADKSNPTDKSKKYPELPLYLIAALFVLFIVIFTFVYGDLLPDQKPPSDENKSVSKTSSKNEFLASILTSDELAIVMTISNIAPSQSQLIYTCGVGFAGSWGALGKNISNLHLYVIEGDNCTYSTPIPSNKTNLTTVRQASECEAEYREKARFDIRYGPSSTIFTNRSAFVLIDETFGADCSFGIPQPLLTDTTAKAPAAENESIGLDDLINQRIDKTIIFVNETATANETTTANETLANATANETTTNETASATTETNTTANATTTNSS